MRLGETYVHGKSPETANVLLAACDIAGVPRFVVKTTDSGFVVPDAVWDAAEATLTDAPEPF